MLQSKQLDIRLFSKQIQAHPPSFFRTSKGLLKRMEMNLDELMYLIAIHLLLTPPVWHVGVVALDDFSWKSGIQYRICWWQLFSKNPDYEYLASAGHYPGSRSMVQIRSLCPGTAPSLTT